MFPTCHDPILPMYHRHPLNFLKVIRDETSGDYGKMMSYAISSRSDYIGEMIDAVGGNVSRIAPGATAAALASGSGQRCA